MEYILSIDQGTTSTRACLFTADGRVAGSAQREFRQIYPAPGMVEHDPQDIMGSVMSVAAEAMVRAGASPSHIRGVGITNQRETTIVWDKNTGKPVYNAIVWQCRRTAEYCEKLKNSPTAKEIYRRTGLIPDAYFSATKLKWILENVDGAYERARRGELAFGTVDTYIMWRLSGGKIFATDYTNAARTMLFDIRNLKWDNWLLDLFGIPASMLPEAYPSGHLFGYTTAEAFGAPIPLAAVAGDQQSALFGHLCLSAGDLKNTYGTGCFLLMNTGDKFVESKNGLVTTLGACTGGRPPYVLEGSVFIGGAAVQWLRDGLSFFGDAAESEKLATSVKDNGGVYLVPAFTGLGAPYWNGEARGLICGITRGTTRAHIARAALESIAYQVGDLVQAMSADAGAKITRLAVDGGASANDFLMKFQADILGCEVARPAAVEATARGAAYLAGLQTGFWKDEASLPASREVKVFTPTADESERSKLIAGWRKAVSRAL